MALVSTSRKFSSKTTKLILKRLSRLVYGKAGHNARIAFSEALPQLGFHVIVTLVTCLGSSIFWVLAHLRTGEVLYFHGRVLDC